MSEQLAVAPAPVVTRGAGGYTRNRKWSRTALVGILYSFPLALFTSLSPFFRKALKQNKNAHVLFFASAGSHAIGSMTAYRMFLEPPPQEYRASFRPNLGHVTSVVPGLGAIAFGHLVYPGIFILLGEKTWYLRRTEYRRLTIKCTLAFLPAHLMVVVPYSLILGALIKRSVKSKKEDDVK